MKRLLIFALMASLTLSASSAELNKKAKKVVKKQAKTLVSEGWQSYSEKSILEQVTAVYVRSNMKSEQGE